MTIKIWISFLVRILLLSLDELLLIASIIDLLKPGGGLDGYLNDDDSEVGFEDRVEEEDLKDDPIFLLDLPVRLQSCACYKY